MEIANGVVYGLAGGVWSGDKDHAVAGRPPAAHRPGRGQRRRVQPQRPVRRLQAVRHRPRVRHPRLRGVPRGEEPPALTTSPDCSGSTAARRSSSGPAAASAPLSAAGLAAFGATVVCADADLEAGRRRRRAARWRRQRRCRSTCSTPASIAAAGRRRRRTGRARDDAVGERAQADRRLRRRRARPRRRPQPQGHVPAVPHVRRADGRGRARLDDRLLLDPVADDRAGPGRVRGDEGGDGDAVQDARRRARTARRAGQHDRPRRRRDAADGTDQGPARVVRRRTPTRRSCGAGRSHRRWSAPSSTLRPMPAATSPARRSSSTVAGRRPTAASTRRPERRLASPDECASTPTRWSTLHPAAGAHPERARPGPRARRAAGRRARRRSRCGRSAGSREIDVVAPGRPNVDRRRRGRRRAGTDADVRGPHRRRHRGRRAGPSTRSAARSSTAGCGVAARPT